MNRLLFYTIFSFISYEVFAQGSGNSLNFNLGDDYVLLSDNNTMETTDGTFECWFKFDGSVPQGALLFSRNANFSVNNISISAGISPANNLRFFIDEGGGQITANGTSTIATDTWYHVACVWGSGGMQLYVNGILEATNPHTGNGDGATQRTTLGAFVTGGTTTASFRFDGQIEEARIWNVARTQAQIRDNMCQSLTGSEAGLVSYYNFDDDAGTTLTDQAGSNNGTLMNMVPASDWGTSGAPIGDASVHTYGGSSLTMSSSQGNLTVDNFSGSPNMHIYRVDSVPNDVTGVSSLLGTNSTYYGTFIAGGTAPTYDATFDYSRHM